MSDQRNGGPRCQRCGGAATHRGWAFPAGGSFPVTGCMPCLALLAKDMEVTAAPIDAEA